MKEPTFSEMLSYCQSKGSDYDRKIETQNNTIFIDLQWTLQTYSDTVKEQISNGFNPSKCDICLEVKSNLTHIYKQIKEYEQLFNSNTPSVSWSKQEAEKRV